MSGALLFFADDKGFQLSRDYCFRRKSSISRSGTPALSLDTEANGSSTRPRRTANRSRLGSQGDPDRG